MKLLPKVTETPPETSKGFAANGRRKENVPKATIALFCIPKINGAGLKVKEKVKAKIDPNPRIAKRTVKGTKLLPPNLRVTGAVQKNEKILNQSEANPLREKWIASPVSST